MPRKKQTPTSTSARVETELEGKTTPRSKKEQEPVWYTHHHHHNNENPFAYSVVELQGRRASMEDAFAVHTVPLKVDVKSKDSNSQHPVSLFGVFDGHGGTECVKYVEENLLKSVTNHRSFKRNTRRALVDTFKAVDDEFCSITQKAASDGTTATVAVLKRDFQAQPLELIVANTGDTRAVLVKKDNTVIPLTRDHHAKHEDEQERIFDAGGTIFHDTEEDIYRVGGVLAVSRAFGNRQLKPFVTAEPEVSHREISLDDRYLVIASDGLWDTVKNEEVGVFLSTHGLSKGTAELAQESYARGSYDNICILAVDLQSVGSPPREMLSTVKRMKSRVISGNNPDEHPAKRQKTAT